MKNIQDLCRDRKDEMRITAQIIADESGVPISTVNNFFSSASKKPALETAGPICRVLGVSIDLYYQIEAPIHELTEHEKELAEHDLAHEKETKELLLEVIKQKNRVIHGLFGLCLMLLLLLVLYLVIDARIVNAGLIQFGTPSAIGWAIIAIAVVSVSVLAAVIKHIRRK